MIDKIVNILKDKNLAILGFGKEGKSSYKFIRKYVGNQNITIIDKNDLSSDILVKDDNNLNFIYGDNYLSDLDKYDLIIKTPGITLKDIDYSKFKNKIISQLELLLMVNKKNIIGVTGTKGKSTTSSLIYEVIKNQNRDCYLLGNIGVPVLDLIDNYKGDTILVIEMSSHQLEFVDVSPHIGIILNLFQDHLDHAGSLKHYHDNKMNMFKYQDKEDYALYSSDNEYLIERIKNDNYKSKLIDIKFEDGISTKNSIRIQDNKNIMYDGKIVYKDGPRNLIGDHNLKNIMFVVAICEILGLDIKKAKESISNFKGLKYRMECIGTYDNITYYNDTIATIPQATISALKAIKNVDTLIFGGMDRKIDYKEFIEYLKKSDLSNLVCMPTTGYTIGNQLKDSAKNIYYVNTLEEAFEISKNNTRKGYSCLLSPAAASYEFFKNFEEKGERFEKIVKGEINSILNK